MCISRPHRCCIALDQVHAHSVSKDLNFTAQTTIVAVQHILVRCHHIACLTSPWTHDRARLRAVHQGPDTDRRAVAEIREAVKTGTETSVRLLNYKKNGQPFWNLFTLAPMADVDGNLRFIIGVQVRRLRLKLQPDF